MPIKPIDLQTLFMQLDNVGRERAAEKDGAIIQQAIQSGIHQKKQAEKAETVAELDTSGNDEAAGKVKARDTPQGQTRGSEDRQKKDAKDSSEKEDDGREVVKDPDLGNTIDISG